MHDHLPIADLLSSQPEGQIIPSQFSGRLLLHIGPHKTGTTTVQSFWHDNPDWLRGAGFLYPEAGRCEVAPTQHWALGDALVRFDLASFGNMVRQIDRELQGGPFHTILISTEVLSRKTVSAQNLKLLCEAFPNARRQWVVVLRRQDELLPSLYSEHLKYGLIKFPETYLKLATPEHMDHVRRLQIIADASPDDEILVARFDDIKSDIIGSFNTILAIDSEIKNTVPVDTKQNVSIPGKTLKILRFVNALPWRLAAPIRRRLVAFTWRHRKWFKGYAINPERVAAVQRQYLPGNLTIEKTLFQNLSGQLARELPDLSREPVPLSADLRARLHGWNPERRRFFPEINERRQIRL